MLALAPSPAVDLQQDPAITIAEAATLFGRSTTWVRNRLTDHSLETAEGRGRIRHVTAESVARLLAELASRRTAKPQPHLRLVVDNTPT